MSEVIKFITEKLTAPPFNRNFNFITFDGLEPGLLLQILSDILGEFDAKHKVDIREETPESTTMRILEALRILRYSVPVEPDELSKFCEGLVVGDKSYIYPILEFILKNFEGHKKRSYLSKFLTKARIPAEFMQDLEVSRLYAEHEALIEAFKNAHKQLESLRSEGLSTTEIKNDITAMQEEKDQILRRINRMKKKLEMFPTSTAMLDMARKLRMERERESKIVHQLQEQRIMIQNLEGKVVEIRQQSSELQRRAADCNAASLLSRLEEEVKVNQYLATDKQPKEIETTKTYLEDLTRVANHPAMTHTFIDQLNQKLREAQAETSRLVERRMVATDPLEDKASIFRQQASIAANRKEATASALAEARENYLTISKQLAEVREKYAKSLKEMGCSDIVNAASYADGVGLNIARLSKTEVFQNYVAELRTKNQAYKEKRAVLNNLRAEKGILTRTLDILKETSRQAKKKLDAAEAMRGISGYWETMEKLEKVSEETANLNERKGSVLEEMSSLVGRLNQQINSRRDKLAPLIRELRPLRTKAQELSQLHAEKKAQYDAFVAGRDAQILRLEQEVRLLREEARVEESRYHYLNAALDILKVQQFRLQEEMRGYLTSTSNTGPADGDGTKNLTVKTRSYRDIYLKKISEQEAQITALKEQQKDLEANESINVRQRKLWADVVTLLESKIASHQAAEAKRAAGGEYADVLQLEVDRILL